MDLPNGQNATEFRYRLGKAKLFLHWASSKTISAIKRRRNSLKPTVTVRLSHTPLVHLRRWIAPSMWVLRYADGCWLFSPLGAFPSINKNSRPSGVQEASCANRVLTRRNVHFNASTHSLAAPAVPVSFFSSDLEGPPSAAAPASASADSACCCCAEEEEAEAPSSFSTAFNAATASAPRSSFGGPEVKSQHSPTLP